jgi:penicillin-binding protein 2
MNSFPDFDPNMFVGRIDDETWNKITSGDQELLINKISQGIYPPGSTFKMLVALAGLDLGAIKPDTKLHCPGYYRVGRDIRYCWRRGGHGDVNVVEAIAQSCNVFFYQVGLLVGVDEIDRYGRMFGFGEPTGLELESEKTGLLPSRTWKEKALRERWYDGETAHLAIGQGFLTVTPIQLLTYVNAIANRGLWVQPALVRRVVATDGSVLLSEDTLPHRTRLLPLPVEQLDLVQEGMWAAVNAAGGTARRAQSKLVEIAGKTGTSQVIGRRARSAEEGLEEDDSLQPHSLFVGFAPRHDPEISVLVLVEHGKSGGETAAPIGRRVVEYYFTEVRPHEREFTPPGREPAETAANPFTGRLEEAFAATSPAQPGPGSR